MNYLKKLVAYFIVNSIVLYLANFLAPTHFVFGRGQIPYWQALFTTAFGLMIAVMIYDLVVYDFKLKMKPETYIGIETFVNVGTLYLFARTPLQNSVAVGIGAFWVAILVGLSMSLVQYGAKYYTEHQLK